MNEHTKSVSLDKKNIDLEVATHKHGRVPSPLRRQQLLAHTYALFLHQGYEKTTLDDIARSMGVSKPVIYQLVTSKEKLLEEILILVQNQINHAVQEAIDFTKSPREVFFQGISAYIAWIEENEEDYNLTMSSSDYVSTMVDSKIRNYFEETIQLFLQKIPTYAAASQEDINFIAGMIRGAIEGALEHRRLEQPSVQAEKLTHLIMNFLDTGVQF